eukprot:TRINITY_DN1724_c0_g1_i1.p1 TRINITY_DN1724_c0_g1~~TRINITY_DN1724_c0_g1_i1.p1  ORF type:complete len:221 (+),score=-17.69 TRINITY_DN1724_c0_g1_i1:838-1500(+)
MKIQCNIDKLYTISKFLLIQYIYIHLHMWCLTFVHRLPIFVSGEMCFLLNEFKNFFQKLTIQDNRYINKFQAFNHFQGTLRQYGTSECQNYGIKLLQIIFCTIFSHFNQFTLLPLLFTQFLHNQVFIAQQKLVNYALIIKTNFQRSVTFKRKNFMNVFKVVIFASIISIVICLQTVRIMSCASCKIYVSVQFIMYECFRYIQYLVYRFCFGFEFIARSFI